MLVTAIREFLRCSGPDENEGEEHRQELLDHSSYKATLHL
jgi:hypothetical protein